MESKSSPIRYFLGANTARGFTSFYNEFIHTERGDTIWYIKGGPGNGKSSLMKSIAQEAVLRGETVEYAYCSGDPDSLDGIYLRKRHTAYVDATSPHVQEPEEPGASGRYLDLSGCFHPGLTEKREEIRRLFSLYREQYQRCYQLLSAASEAAPEKTPGIIWAADRTAVRQRASAFAARFLQPGKSSAKEHRFLSAFTCRGPVFFWETAQAVGRVCTLDNALGLADDFLQELSIQCERIGCPCILSPDPLEADRLEGIMIPSCSIAVLATKKQGDYPGAVWKHIRLDAIAEPSSLRQHREEYRRCAVLQEGLLQQAESSLREAKRIHDDLEAVYRPYLDTEKLDEIMSHHKAMLFEANTIC